jgi:hypothetical protein
MKKKENMLLIYGLINLKRNNMETNKCTCERPDDNTCDYCEQQSSIQILKEAAENFYREFPSNPLDKPEWNYNRDVDCFKKRKAFINGAKWQSERMYSEEDMIEFGEWVSHNDWVYLPSKKYWVNEEQEELEQKLSSQELLQLWKEQRPKTVYYEN